MISSIKVDSTRVFFLDTKADQPLTLVLENNTIEISSNHGKYALISVGFSKNNKSDNPSSTKIWARLI